MCDLVNRLELLRTSSKIDAFEEQTLKEAIEELEILAEWRDGDNPEIELLKADQANLVINNYCLEGENKMLKAQIKELEQISEEVQNG